MSQASDSTQETTEARALLRTLSSITEIAVEYQQYVEQSIGELDHDDLRVPPVLTDNSQLLGQAIKDCDKLLNELLCKIDDDEISLPAKSAKDLQRIIRLIQDARRADLRARTRIANHRDQQRSDSSISSSHISWDQPPNSLGFLGNRPATQPVEIPSPVPYADEHDGDEIQSHYSFDQAPEPTPKVTVLTRDRTQHQQSRMTPNVIPPQMQTEGSSFLQHQAARAMQGPPKVSSAVSHAQAQLHPQSGQYYHLFPFTSTVNAPTSTAATRMSPILTTSAAQLVTPISHPRLTQAGLNQINSHQNANNLLGSPSTHQSRNVKLPKIDLQKFDGDLRKYKAFIDMHRSTIGDDLNLSPVMKLHYLNASLTGDAKKVTEFLDHIDGSYQIALNLLEENFNHPAQAKDEARDRLAKVRRPRLTAHDLRIFKIEIESNLQCLQSLGEDINHGYYINLIFSLLPPAISEQIRRIEEDKSKWTITQLRSQIAKEIRIRSDHLATCEKVSETSETHEMTEPCSTAEALATQARASNRQWYQNQQVTPNNRGYQSQLGSQNNRQYYGQQAVQSRQSEFRNQTFNRPQAGPLQQQPVQPVTNCVFCDGRHFNAECRNYKTFNERAAQIRTTNRCLRCLRSNHTAKYCQIPDERLRCRKCQTQGHATAMCPNEQTRGNLNNTMITNAEGGSHHNYAIDNEANHVLTISEEQSKGHDHKFTFLETAIHNVSSESNQFPQAQIRALHDTASNRSFITRELANRLNLNMKEERPLNVDVFGAKTTQMSHATARIKLHLEQGEFLAVDVSVVPQIMATLKRIPLPRNVYNAIPKGIKLADPPPLKVQSRTVDLLVGQNAYHDIMNGNRIKVPNGPYLLSSKVGWIVAGTTNSEEDNRPATAHVQTYTIDDDFRQTDMETEPARLTKAVNDMFSLEAIGITDDPTLKEDDTALAEFNARTIFKDNRYYVPWLWRNNAHLLPTNKVLARKRFENTVKKLSKEPEMLKRYNEVMKGQLQLGVLEIVTETNAKGRVHYISHHAVETPHKATTKLRVVYDASAKESKSSPSLNECLYRGPLWLENMVSILLRFRMHKIGLVADIEKAFLQVGLLEDERDVTRLFWLKDIEAPLTDDNVAEYRFTRVAFGMKPSSFLLDGAIMLHMRNDQPDQDIADDIAANHYVDNVISGRSNFQEAKRYYDAAKAKFSRASMNLREWATNSKELMNYIPDKDKVSDKITKVLGVQWNTETDKLRISTQSERKSSEIPEKVTPNTILSLLSQVFDPFGILSPVTLRGKIMMQEIAKCKIRWNREIPPESLVVFKEIHADQLAAGQLSFARYIANLQEIKSAVLHCFCDASAKAYGTVIYMTHSSMDLPRLVYAKNRVAPKNTATLTLPRLELMALLVGVRALRFVQNSLKFQFKAFVWSDSQIALSWLDSDKVLETFVRNRVNEINQKPRPTFRYVPTQDNPADKSSRGTRLSELDDVWWYGPKWIVMPQTDWPPPFTKANSTSHEDDISKPVHENTCIVATSANVQSHPFLDIDEKRFKNPNRLIRAVAYCLRFVNRLLKRESEKKGMEVVSEEFRQAQNFYLKQQQQQSFQDVYVNPTKSRKSIVKQLGVFKDEDGLLRCSGRLAKINAPEATKFPVLLPSNTWFTKITCEKIHEITGHCGTNYTLAKVRRSYWIPKGKSVVKKITRQCVPCTKCAPRSYNLPMMPDLPTKRVTKSAPFSHTGLDYFGPLYVFDEDKSTSTKVWVCLFTCLAIRAVHLEVVQNMTSHQFQLALRRFCATYSVPKSIICDNARQFKAMANVAQQMQQLCSIKWHFIVDYAPWQGGVYERMVQVVKRCLKKVLGNARLSGIELTTVLKEVQDIVNDRPITSISDDPSDYQALTPKKFLYPYDACPTGGLVERPATYDPGSSTSEKLIELWNRGKGILQEFWTQWNTEYLLSLRESARWCHKTGKLGLEDTPKVNEVVLVREPAIPTKVKWRLARIDESILSKDGRCRAVKVRMPNGQILTRPVNFIAPLECHLETNEDKQKSEKSKERPQPSVKIPTRIQSSRKCKAQRK